MLEGHSTITCFQLLSDRRADISSRSGKQLQHTMENSTDSMSDLDYKSLVNQCLEMCSALKDKGCKFSLSLRLGSSFNFSLSSEGCSPPEATQKPRRSPSYLRRQTLRRAAFLQRKKKPPLAEETASTGNDNNVCRQEGSDLLDKKVASSGQTAQKEDVAVDKDCPLNLNPTPLHPRESVESVESDDLSEEDTVDCRGLPVGYPRRGSSCEMCQQIIVEGEYRHYPFQCTKCWLKSMKETSIYNW